MEANKPWKDEDTRKRQWHLPHPVDSTPWPSAIFLHHPEARST
jgi:hypothetical protein